MKTENYLSQFVMYLSALFYGIAVVYVLNHDSIYTTGMMLGVVLLIFALTGDLSVALVCGSVAGIVAVKRKMQEGFLDVEDKKEEETEEPFEEEEEEVKPKKKKSKKKAPPPNNGERAEFLELGKKYKAPSEDDDKEFHLDAGTTFLNAYKSLKPDQVASMTKDTQDLMQTQKQLMSTLHTLKPLIKDGKEMMNMFQSYFGAGDPTTA